MKSQRVITSLVPFLFILSSVPAWSMGLLIPNQQGASPLAIESHRVEVRVTDGAAVTHVDQVFRNSSGAQLEATYLFPLPSGAAVSEFALYINGVRTVGEVLDSAQARQIYNNIVRQVQDPGLIEYVDGRLFQASIFPVPANGTQRVELEFAQVLERQGDMHRFVYPLRTGRTSGTTLSDFTLTVRVESSHPLGTVYSPTHSVDLVRENERVAVVGMEQQHADLEQDFVLYMSAADEELGMNLLAYDADGRSGEDGYFLMVLAPRLQSEGQIPAKDVTFVVDTSGSMAGEKIEQARETLRYCVSQLRPSDRFNVLRFSTTTRNLFNDLTAVTPESVARANTFIGEFQAAGGTAIEEALTRAIGQTTDPARPHMIIFITDGLPTVGETDAGTLVSTMAAGENGNARIFTFGVGFDVDTTLLDALASGHRGVSDYVLPDEEIQSAVSTLYDRVAYPVLTDVNMSIAGAETYDVFPRQLPDLFAGQQLVISGRYSGHGEHDVALSGQFAGRSMSYDFEQDFSSNGATDERPNDFIPQLWATRKVGFLIDQIRLNGETQELRNEVMNLGVQYGLVTPYTSYLAVDDSEFRQPRMWDDDVTARRSGWGMEEDSDDRGASAEPAMPMASTDGNFELEASGRDAVVASEETRRLREIEHSDNRTPVRRIGGRTMNLDSDGVWRGNRAQANTSARRMNIRYLSDAYFELVEIRPDLARMVAVGERVELEVNSSLVVLIDATGGIETLDEASRAALNER